MLSALGHLACNDEAKDLLTVIARLKLEFSMYYAERKLLLPKFMSARFYTRCIGFKALGLPSARVRPCYERDAVLFTFVFNFRTKLEANPAEAKASHILAVKLRHAALMTLHSKIWAIGTLIIFLPLGAIVMVGIIPGSGSDIQAMRGFAISTSHLVEQHGAFVIGLFYMAIGCVLAALFLVWGDDLRRSSGDGSGAFDDCGGGD